MIFKGIKIFFKMNIIDRRFNWHNVTKLNSKNDIQFIIYFLLGLDLATVAFLLVADIKSLSLQIWWILKSKSYFYL